MSAALLGTIRLAAYRLNFRTLARALVHRLEIEVHSNRGENIIRYLKYHIFQSILKRSFATTLDSTMEQYLSPNPTLMYNGGG